MSAIHNNNRLVLCPRSLRLTTPTVINFWLFPQYAVVN